MGGHRVPEYGSDAVVDLLLDLDIEFLACNPGASFRGLHDSIVNYGGNRPRLVQCAHEEISIAVAHGYAKATGRLMATAVHDVVGLQHASMAIFNAWCDRVPILVLGATGPMDSTRRRPWIDWIHTANVQGTQVRDYTKWDDQPAAAAAMPESLIRATQIATTRPYGPVYVCLDVDLQEERLSPGFEMLHAADFTTPATMAPDPLSIRTVAEWLVDSEEPIIIADRAGRDEATASGLVTLSELLSIPVIDADHVAFNFPTDHPMNLSGAKDELLPKADIVLGLEARDLFGALHVSDGIGLPMIPRLRPGTRVVNVTLDMLMPGSWAADFQRLQPADITIPADVAGTVEALIHECRRIAATRPDVSVRVEVRRQRLAEKSAAMRRAWAAEATQAGGRTPVPRAALAAAVGDAIADRDFVLANGNLGGWTHRLWSMRRWYHYLGHSGGAGLGYGLGASIGAALGHPDKLVLDLQADGDSLYTPAALWTLAHEKLPVLVIMDNNRAYQNSVEHAEVIADARNRPVANASVGTTITDPEVDFAAMARSFGVHAEGPIEDPSALPDALARALKVVDAGRPALLDVVTEPR